MVDAYTHTDALLRDTKVTTAVTDDFIISAKGRPFIQTTIVAASGAGTPTISWYYQNRKNDNTWMDELPVSEDDYQRTLVAGQAWSWSYLFKGVVFDRLIARLTENASEREFVFNVVMVGRVED